MLVLAGLSLALIAQGAVDVTAEFERQRTRRSQVLKLFVPSMPPGPKNEFDGAITAVLNLSNRVKSQRIISELSLSARDRLKEACEQALLWEFLGEWTEVRQQLESEVEPSLVPDPARIAPLNKWKEYALTYALRDDASAYQPKTMDPVLRKRARAIRKILLPIVQSPDEGPLEKAYADVGPHVVAALQGTGYNGSAVARMLESVADKLRREAIVEVPVDHVNKINQVELYVRVIEQAIKHYDSIAKV